MVRASLRGVFPRNWTFPILTVWVPLHWMPFAAGRCYVVLEY